MVKKLAKKLLKVAVVASVGYFAGPLIGLTAVKGAVVFGVTAASITYQRDQAKKQQERLKAALDERKGFEVPTESASNAIPVCYGRNLIGGTFVYFNTKSFYTHSDVISQPGANNISFSSNLNESLSGNRNEFLFTQQVLCHGPINKIIDWQIGDQKSNTPELAYGQRIHVYTNGNISDFMMTLNFNVERTDSVFSNMAYSSSVFRLNRDDPQYRGVPGVSFYIEGLLVRPVIKVNDTYSLGNYFYSNNPAYCLLDYLLNDRYGRGLDTIDLDLKSFYDAAKICDTIVQENVFVKGTIWEKQNISRRNLPLYECNILLDTNRSIRDNILSLLNTMGEAELVWSGGKYKLKLQYPLTLGLNDPVPLSAEKLIDYNGYKVLISNTITEDQIINSSIQINYPNSQERMNFCNIKFLDEAQDFKENTASWPPKSSSVYQTFLQKDNNVPLETTITGEGVTDYYHALALAEEFVRLSRSNVNYTFEIMPNDLIYEPGDILRVNESELLLFQNELIKIREIKYDDNGVAQINAEKYDPAQLAWNAKDDQIVPVRNNYNFRIEPPSAVTFNYYPELATTGGIGYLEWTPPEGIQPANYFVEFAERGKFFTFLRNWQSLGTTANNKIDIFSLKTGRYDFSVRSRSTLGSFSSRATTGFISVSDGTEIAPSIRITDEIVLSAGKVITNLYVEILSPPINNLVSNYEVQVRKQGDLNWISLGVSKESIREYANVVDQAVYEVQARVINKVGGVSTYTLNTHRVIGKTAPPSNVLNFNAINKRDGIKFYWEAISDFDRDLYEIRTGLSWDNSTLVVQTKETEFIIEKPTVGQKLFFIKAIDTTGNYSLNESFAEVTVNPPAQVVVNVTIVGENYLLQWDEPESVQPIEGYIIKQDDVELTIVKSTTLTSKVQWVGTSSFSVIAVDVAGNQSNESITQITVTAPPATSIRSQVIDNNVLLSWNNVRGTLPTIGYEIRKGNTLLNSELIGFLNGEFTVVFESVSGDFTYWVIPRDSAGNLGVPNNITARVSQPPDYVLVVDYFSDFSGTRVNVSNAPGGGILLPFDDSRTWESQFIGNSWDSIQDAINNTYTIYIQPSVVSGYYEEIYDYGTILGAMKVKVIPTIEILSGNPSYQTDISISADGINYIDYTNLDEIFGTNFRYIKFRITVNTPSDKDVFYLSKINLVLDAKQKTESNKLTVLDTDIGGTTVIFQENFLDVTSITLSANSTSPVFTIYDFVDTPNPTSFKILAFDSVGDRVTVDVSWTARGY